MNPTETETSGKVKAMADHNDPSKNPEMILELIKEIGIQERHFNESIDKYKAMASTWLLAVFGAIGFVIANIKPWLLFTAGIGLAGGIGILLLWIIDIRVYQQLLASAFTEGLKLEKQHDWLPKTRHNMVRSQQTGSVTVNLSWFYILGVSVPLLIFNFSLCGYLFFTSGVWTSLAFVIVSGLFLFYLIFKIRFTSREEGLQKEYVSENEIENRKRDRRDRRLLIIGGCALHIGFFLVLYFALASVTF